MLLLCHCFGNAQDTITPSQLFQNNKHKWCAKDTDSPYSGYVYGNFIINRDKINNLGRLRELGVLFDGSVNYYNENFPSGFIRFGFTGDVVVSGYIQNGKECDHWQVYYEDTVIIMNYWMNKGFIDSDIIFYDKNGLESVIYRYYYTKWWQRSHARQPRAANAFYSKIFLRLPSKKDVTPLIFSNDDK